MFNACTTGDMAHIDTIFKFLPHMRRRGCIASIFFTAVMIHAFRSARSTNGLVCRRVLCILCTRCMLHSNHRGYAVAQWLRHCATNQEVVGSIPDGVTGIFHCHNPSGLTVALGSTQPLTEMSTRNISWG
jgi:hypothetical protein